MRGWGSSAAIAVRESSVAAGLQSGASRWLRWPGRSGQYQSPPQARASGLKSAPQPVKPCSASQCGAAGSVSGKLKGGKWMAVQVGGGGRWVYEQ